MKEMNLSTKAMPSSRIHISNSPASPSSHYLSFKAHPPRPPCWQDFIGKTLRTDDRQDAGVSVSLSSAADSDKKQKGQRTKYKKSTTSTNTKTKNKGISSSSVIGQAKLKRTRSEPSIAEKEIPPEALQARLTSQQLSKQSIDEAKRYLEDAYLKCSQWLAQISPGTCIPLDDADFQMGSGDIITCDDETRKEIDYHMKRHSLALDKIPE
ncbi:uncharacterized protein [Watersipora subatra]|uniref:uncharacterized protein n=1 Tax=Watersipora subatra TaxID=2589382 RepID=UPI00355C0654